MGWNPASSLYMSAVKVAAWASDEASSGSLEGDGRLDEQLIHTAAVHLADILVLPLLLHFSVLLSPMVHC
jgi:hypothetical protein